MRGKDLIKKVWDDLEHKKLLPLHSKYNDELKGILKNLGKKSPKINFVITKAQNPEKAFEVEKTLIDKINTNHGTTFEPVEIEFNDKPNELFFFHLYSDHLIKEAIDNKEFFYTSYPHSESAKFIDNMRNLLIYKYFPSHKIIEEPKGTDTGPIGSEFTTEKRDEPEQGSVSASEKVKRDIKTIFEKPSDK